MGVRDLEGYIDFPGGLRLLSGQSLDARFVGKDLNFLNSILEADGAYPGLKVFIESENNFYIYKKDGNGDYKFLPDSDIDKGAQGLDSNFFDSIY